MTKKDRIKIDKIALNNIEVVGFTSEEKYKELLKNGALTYNKEAYTYSCRYGFYSFTKLHIKDDIVDNFCCGVKVLNKSIQRYGVMQLSVKDKKYGNLIGYTLGEYISKLNEIKGYLKNKYGIIIDYSNAGFKEIELNKTFKLEHDFNDYRRVINLMMCNLPGAYHLQADYRTVTDGLPNHETYYASNKRSKQSRQFLELKIYNKSKSLTNIIKLKDDYMRIELKLVGTEKIKKSLQTNKIMLLCHEQLADYYYLKMDELIIKPLQKWDTQKDKALLKIMQQQRETEKNWILNTLRIISTFEIENEQPLILDISDVIKVVDKLKIDKKRVSETKQNFIKQSQKIENFLCNNDNDKLIEIVRQISVNSPSEVRQLTDNKKYL